MNKSKATQQQAKTQSSDAVPTHPVEEQTPAPDPANHEGEELSSASESKGVVEAELRLQAEALAEARQTAELQQQRYQQLFELAPDGYIVTNLDGMIKIINRVAATMLNMEARYLTRKPLAIYVAPNHRSFFRRQLNRIRDGAVERWEAELRPRDLPAVNVLISVVRSYSPLVNTDELLWQIKDLTEFKQREQAEREQYFRVTFEQSPVGMAHVGDYGILIRINPKLRALLGFSKMDFHPLTLFEFVVDEDRAMIRTLFSQLVSGQTETARREISYVSKGGVVHTLTNLTAVRSTSGEFQYAIVVMEDITERRLAEEKLKQTAERDNFLLMLSDKLRPLADPIEIQGEAARMLGEYLKTNRVVYAEIAGEDAVIHVDYANDVPSLNGHMKIDDFGPSLAKQLIKGESVVMEDIYKHEELTAAERSAFAELDIRAFITIPLIKTGWWVAALSVYSSEVRSWTSGDIQLAKEVADRTWSAVERSYAEAALRKSEAKYRILFERMDQGFCVIQMIFDENEHPVDYRFIEVNPAFEKQTGIQDATGKRMRAIAPEHEEHWFEIYGEIALTGRAIRFENRADQLHRYYDVSAFRVGAPEKRQVAVFFYDITERKRIEAAEHAQRLLAETLQDTALVLTSSLEFTDVTDHILTSIERLVPHDVASLLLIKDQVAYVHRARGYGAEGESLEMDLQDFHIAIDESDHLLQMHKTQKPVLRPLWQDHGNWDQVPAMTAMRSLVAVPILERNKVLGFLKLHSHTPNFFTEDHVRLLQSFAVQAAIAIQNARAHEDALALAAQNERHRLARDLHDAVTQTLFSVNVIADSIPLLWQDTPQQIQVQLQQLQLLTRGALAEMRTLLLELRPEYLANIDLSAQLRQLLDAVQARKRIEVHFTVQLDVQIPSTVRITLYRIAQEALNNIVKHAHASEVCVWLTATESYVELVIQDNGIGFNNHGKLAGFGLHSMRERTEEVGATLDIVTRPEMGTRIRVVWGDEQEG